MQYILRENARNYRKGLLFKPIAALQGQGLLTSEGDLWVRQRRLMQPAFYRRQLATFATVMVDEARAVVQEWRHPMRTGTPVDVAERMHRLTFNVVGRVLLGADPGALDAYQWHPAGHRHAALALYECACHPAVGAPALGPHTAQLAVFDAPWPSTMPLCSRSSRHGVKPGSAQEGQATDVLALLLAACDDTPGVGMSDRQLRDEVITLIGAGAETSAHALSWTWYLLAQHPEVACRVHDRTGYGAGRPATHPAGPAPPAVQSHGAC